MLAHFARALLAIATLTALCAESTGGISSMVTDLILSPSRWLHAYARFACGCPIKSKTSTVPCHAVCPSNCSTTGTDSTCLESHLRVSFIASCSVLIKSGINQIRHRPCALFKTCFHRGRATKRAVDFHEIVIRQTQCNCGFEVFPASLKMRASIERAACNASLRSNSRVRCNGSVAEWFIPPV